ncbi:hypothetical protein IJ541_01385 [bacterium]|nr:hypothetical protein [bacterium]
MRTTNLIQSYVNGNPVTQQYNADKAVKDFDIHKELNNRTFIKPLPSNGKLVRNSLFDIPSEIRKDWIYDFKSFKHALKGEANDHELGRLNDVGMKLGGLAIAAYLFTKKQTPMTKLFEFVGLGTFFAAMDLWPKLFIQLPAYLVHGVNVRQEYEDSFGRKKMFYQDHQFIPWDLYSEQEINNIGDSLNVPKNIPNRREFIQEKMRKIALQNNTLWMLTAGFATPLMSALMCNALEGPAAKMLNKFKSQKADALMSDFSSEIKKYSFEKQQKQFEDLLKANAGKPITPELYEAIKSQMTNGLDYMVADALKKDLAIKIPAGNSFKLSQESVDSIQGALKAALSSVQMSDEEFAKIMPDGDAISNALSNKNLLNGDYSDFSEHSKVIQSLLEEKIEQFIQANPDSKLGKKLKFALQQFIHSGEVGVDSSMFKMFKQVPSTVLTPELIESLKEVSSAFNVLKSEQIVLDKYSHMKAALAPETSLADSWNEITEKIFKQMNFTPEEIKKGRVDVEVAGEVFRNKIESIVADKTAYENLIEVVEKCLSELHGKMAAIDMTQDASNNLYKSHVISSFDGAADVLRRLGFNYSVDSLVGFGDNAATSAKALMLEFIEERKLGVKSSFYRLLNTLDVFYRIGHAQGIDGALTPQMLREVKEECAELAKTIMLGAHSSDYAVKFWQLRNPSPHQGDYSQIEVKDGKVVNRYFGTHQSGELVEFANDRNYFEAVMKLMNDGDIHPATRAKIKDSAFLSDFEHYRRQVLEVLGCDEYFVKPNHKVDGKTVWSTSLERFLLTGSAGDEMAYKYFNQTFNSKKWFSMFGKLGAGLVGVTLLAQFFFGRMKKPEAKSKEVK